jgi:S-DNA-T family DNA segregation ATPase FtsK/SpoIIIE
MKVGLTALTIGAIGSQIIPDNGKIINGSNLLISFGISSLCWYCTKHTKYDRAFIACELCNPIGGEPNLKRRKYENGYTLYEFTLPAGVSIEDFEEKSKALSEYVGRNLEIEYGYKNIIIKEYPLNAKTFYEFKPISKKYKVPILIGYDKKEEPLLIDLTSGEPHMIIAGETGSGKSSVLRSIIMNLILTKPEVELYLIDVKRTELNIFKDKASSFARTSDEASIMLKQIQFDIESRYDLLSESYCNDINSYNEKYKNGKIPYRVVIFDEFAQLVDDRNKDTIKTIEHLTAISRAAGYYFILSTQRPDSQIINGRIKANCTNIYGLKCQNEINSRVIIDDAGLEKLRGKGHGMFKRGGEIIEVQAPYLSISKAEEYLNEASHETELDQKRLKLCTNRPCYDFVRQIEEDDKIEFVLPPSRKLEKLSVKEIKPSDNILDFFDKYEVSI